MTRRAFFKICLSVSLFLPGLSYGIGAPRDEGELIIVDGWILRKSDLREKRE